jgi:hypothetical protein
MIIMSSPENHSYLSKKVIEDVLTDKTDIFPLLLFQGTKRVYSLSFNIFYGF